MERPPVKISIEGNYLVLSFGQDTQHTDDPVGTAIATAEIIIQALLEPIAKLNPDAYCNDPSIYHTVKYAYDSMSVSFDITIH